MTEQRILTRSQLVAFAIAHAIAHRFPSMPLSIELKKDPLSIPNLKVRAPERPAKPGVVFARDHRKQRPKKIIVHDGRSGRF